ncbi:MAG: hypothetical protein HY786_06650 [Deltaproteobacteria bacterium]|nr:hypothetical protein [Deltaproteobacteria bacterium]
MTALLIWLHRDQADVYSIQIVDGKTVKAAVREVWEDPKTGELYVWMVIQ